MKNTARIIFLSSMFFLAACGGGGGGSSVSSALPSTGPGLPSAVSTIPSTR